VTKEPCLQVWIEFTKILPKRNDVKSMTKTAITILQNSLGESMIYVFMQIFF